MRMYDVIAKKRDGGTLNHDELAFACLLYTSPGAVRHHVRCYRGRLSG